MPKKSQIEQLLHDICPNGVNYTSLENMCVVLNAPKKLKRQEYQETGLYPIIDQGKEYIVGYTDDESALMPKAEYVIFGDHSREVKYANFAFAQGADGLKILKAREGVLPRYLYHSLLNLDVPSRGYNRHWSIAKELELPFPPMPIQEEIVRLLDTFTDLVKNIDDEIVARQKQLQDSIEILYNGVQADWTEKSLGEIGQVIKGSGIQKDDFVEYGRPCIHYGQIHTYYGTSAIKTKSFITEELYSKCKKAKTGDLVIATTSEDVPACCKATAWLGKEDVAVSGDAHILHHNQDPLFMAYLFRTERFSEQRAMAATGAKVTRVSGDRLASFRFFFPPLAEQRAIAEKLDTIEAFINNLKTERDLRQQQYEYYREHLINLLK